MSHRRWLHRLFGGAAALFLMAACQDSSTEPGSSVVAGPSVDFSTPPAASTLPGRLVICKDTPTGTSGTFIFDVMVTYPDGRYLEVSDYLASGECKTFFVSEPDPLMEVIEHSPSGWNLVDVTRILETGERTVLTGGIGLPGTPATCVIDLSRGCLLVFRNEPTDVPPPPPPPPPPSSQGCTPGYWKQVQHFDSWVGYSPTQSWKGVFGVNLFPARVSLLDALADGGGDPERLGRHATAALLNAASSSVDFGMTTADVIAAVQAAYAAGTTMALADRFEALNQRGCSLN